MYRELQLMIHDDGGVIIPMFNNTIDAGSSKVKGYVSDPTLQMSGYRALRRSGSRLGAVPSCPTRWSGAVDAAGGLVLVFAGTRSSPVMLRPLSSDNPRHRKPWRRSAVRSGSTIRDPSLLALAHGLRTGRLGTSLANGRPIAEQIGFRLRNSFFLAGVAASIAVPWQLPSHSVRHQPNSVLRSDRERRQPRRNIGAGLLHRLPADSNIRCPARMVAEPIRGFANVRPWRSVARDSLPSVTLTLIVLAHMLRMTRASIIGVMSQPFIEMAFLKGMHAGESLCSTLCNAVAPIIKCRRDQSGVPRRRVIVVEVVFVYPGIGQLMVDAVSNRDVPVVQACGLIFAAIISA